MQPLHRYVFYSIDMHVHVRRNLIVFKHRLLGPTGRGRGICLCRDVSVQQAMGLATHQRRRIELEAQHEFARHSRHSRSSTAQLT